MGAFPETVPLQRLEERLERGEVIYFPVCPFSFAGEDDRDFLLRQRLASRAHKNIGYNPHTGKVRGFAYQSPGQKERLRAALAAFAEGATRWLAGVLPRYAAAWRRDQVSFRPEEESTRVLRLTARNDLLHVDAFPNRPTRGWRILRLFVNINRTEPRVWITADTFATLLERYKHEVGLPTPGTETWGQRVGWALQGLFNPKRRGRTVYDRFMLKFHHFLKANRAFQEGPKTRWEFPPGSAWMCFTDTATHAALRGRYALEHSYFVAPESLALPEESPPALLAKVCGRDVLRRAG